MVKKPGAKSWSMHVLLFPYFQANLRLSHSGVSSTVLLPPSPVYHTRTTCSRQKVFAL